MNWSSKKFYNIIAVANCLLGVIKMFDKNFTVHGKIWFYKQKPYPVSKDFKMYLGDFRKLWEEDILNKPVFTQVALVHIIVSDGNILNCEYCWTHKYNWQNVNTEKFQKIRKEIYELVFDSFTYDVQHNEITPTSTDYEYMRIHHLTLS